MAFCTSCGTQLEPGETTCPVCGKEVTKKQTEDSGNAVKVSQMIDFRLAEGETVVKQYRCCKMKKIIFIRPACRGTLTVTNKRVIFTGKSNERLVTKANAKSMQSSEVKLDTITGMDTFYGTNFIFLLFLLGLILTLGGLYFFFAGFDRYSGGFDVVVGGLALAALGVFVLTKSTRQTFKLKIFGTNVTGSPINVGQGARSYKGNAAILTSVSHTAEDTDEMLEEVGALILDLQTMGDMAISKWKV